MRARSLVPCLAGIALALMLGGCSVHAEAGPVVSGLKLGTTAAKALEEQVGTKPDIDCGDDDIIVVKGKKVSCELTDDNGAVYDVAVTFTSVKGASFHIDVKVADSAKSGPTQRSSDDGSAAGTDDGPSVSGTDIADLAAGALADHLGFTPDIECDDSEVTVEVGNTTDCSFADSEGTDHNVLVTITKLDGSNYAIDAKVTD